MQSTSLFAYRNEILPTLAGRQQKVLEALATRNSFTNRELASYLGWEINTITPRVNELVKKGLVCEVERRICKDTGRTAIGWGLASPYGLV